MKSSRPRRRSPGRSEAGVAAGILQQHHGERRTRPGPRVHRGLLPDVLKGMTEPGRVFDRVVRLEEVPDGYRATNEREARAQMEGR
jgi:hypothetical protein